MIRRFAVIAGAAAVLGLGSVGVFAQSAPLVVGDTVFGCVKPDGTVRIVSSHSACKKEEQKVSWPSTAGAGAVGPAGPMGPAGAQGPAGADGAVGPAGPQGDPGISALEVVKANTSSSSTATQVITALCPAGKVAIGGGAFISPSFNQNVHLEASYPAMLAGNPMPTGWTAAAHEVAGHTGNWSVHAWAICAIVAP